MVRETGEGRGVRSGEGVGERREGEGEGGTRGLRRVGG